MNKTVVIEKGKIVSIESQPKTSSQMQKIELEKVLNETELEYENPGISE